jgi:hypothetical protein
VIDINKFQLVVTPNTITRNAKVTLEVTYPDCDWDDNEFTIAFEGPGVESGACGRKITLKSTCDLSSGIYEYFAAITLKPDSKCYDPHQTPPRTTIRRQASLTVLEIRELQIKLAVQLPVIASGEDLSCHAEFSIPGDYECEWWAHDITGAKLGCFLDPCVTSSSSTVVWKSENVETGKHAVGITVWTKDKKKCGFAKSEIHVAVVNLTSRVTSEMVGWQRLLGVLKANIDQKIDKVADSIESIANRLPAPGQPTAVTVAMQRASNAPTDDLVLWIVIRKSAEALSYRNYEQSMDLVLCGLRPTDPLPNAGQIASEFSGLRRRRFLPYNDADAYRLLKIATEAFLVANCGVDLRSFVPFLTSDLQDLIQRVGISNALNNLPAINAAWVNYLENVNGVANSTLPYLARIRQNLRDEPLKLSIFAAEDPRIDLPQECMGILQRKLTHPCFLELIWSYWHEEGMLVQTMNAISRRFQNVRGNGDRDPLAMVEIDPLRPLNNLLWGYIQDEQHRLAMPRRAYEYDHHYGLTLDGKAIPKIRPADSRSKFLEAFHHLLHVCTLFYQQDDDTTVVADGFPVLNGLREVHLLLSQGAHNQFGDLPTTARMEMLMQQWLLARPEFREFLPSRIMVAYPEPWMDRVDSMKKLQAWSDTSVLHFFHLGYFGEQVLLSVRFGHWIDVTNPAQAANWARFWRAEIQGYIHAYRAVTGVDLTLEPVDSTLPSVLLRRRLAAQTRVA